MSDWLALVIALVGTIAWLAGWQPGTDWGGVVTMKWTSSLCLLALAFNSVVLRRVTPVFHTLNGLVACITTFTTIYVLCSVVPHIEANSWLVAEPEQWANYSVRPGEPSLMTAVLICELGWMQFLLTLSDSGWLRRVYSLVGYECVVVAGICLAGHAFETPVLMFHHAGSTAMALPTAIAFAAIGLAATQTQTELGKTNDALRDWDRSSSLADG